MAFGNKNSTPSFVLTLPMKVTKQDEFFFLKGFVLDARFITKWLQKLQKCGTSCAKRVNIKTL